MFNKIMYVTLLVKDQDKALDFYTKTLGFEKRKDHTGPDGRFLTIAFKGQEREVLLWPGTQEQPNDSAASTPSTAPGSLFIESDDLLKISS